MKSNYHRVIHVLKSRSIAKPKNKVGGARRDRTDPTWKAKNDRALTGRCVTVCNANETNQ